LLKGDGIDEFQILAPSPTEIFLVDALATRFVTSTEAKEELALRGLPVDGIDDVLAQLEAIGALEVAPFEASLSAEMAERYDRQLIYFGELGLHGSTDQAQASLSDAAVLLIGCGGLGSWSASALACAGIGELVLVDDDVIELSNLNRQLLFCEADIGRSKVEVAALALRRHNAELRVSAHQERVRSVNDVRRLLEGVDFVVTTADWPPHELPRWVNQACVEMGKPFLTAGQFLPIVRVGPMVIPGRSACLECQERQTRAAYPLYDELATHRTKRPTVAATLGAASGLVGSFLAMECIHALIGSPPATSGAAVLIDLRTLRVWREEFDRDPDCSGCAPSQA